MSESNVVHFEKREGFKAAVIKGTQARTFRYDGTLADLMAKATAEGARTGDKVSAFCRSPEGEGRWVLYAFKAGATLPVHGLIPTA